MLAALAAHMPAGVRWTEPEGGLFVWVTLPEGVNGAALLNRAIAEANVAFVPGGAFFADGSGANTMRLSYSLPPVEPSKRESADWRICSKSVTRNAGLASAPCHQSGLGADRGSNIRSTRRLPQRGI